MHLTYTWQVIRGGILLYIQQPWWLGLRQRSIRGHILFYFEMLFDFPCWILVPPHVRVIILGMQDLFQIVRPTSFCLILFVFSILLEFDPLVKVSHWKLSMLRLFQYFIFTISCFLNSLNLLLDFGNTEFEHIFILYKINFIW